MEGATEIDIATAKAFHDRGVLFVDVTNESVWKKGHIPGAVNLPYRWDKTDPTKPRYQETTLNKVVDKAEEFILYFRPQPHSECGNAAWEAAKAVAWGYQKVYWLRCGRDWEEAGYPLEEDK